MKRKTSASEDETLRKQTEKQKGHSVISVPKITINHDIDSQYFRIPVSQRWKKYSHVLLQ